MRLSSIAAFLARYYLFIKHTFKVLNLILSVCFRQQWHLFHESVAQRLLARTIKSMIRRPSALLSKLTCRLATIGLIIVVSLNVSKMVSTGVYSTPAAIMTNRFSPSTFPLHQHLCLLVRQPRDASFCILPGVVSNIPFGTPPGPYSLK